jgi:hypothetical protein
LSGPDVPLGTRQRSRAFLHCQARGACDCNLRNDAGYSDYRTMSARAPLPGCVDP